jgi:hypothetical protein
MLQISTNRYGSGNKTRTIDLHQVKVPGLNVMATKLAQPDLYRAIKNIVPGVESSHGWQELTLRLAFFLEEQREAAEAECQ